MLRLIICACTLLFVTGIAWILMGRFTIPVSFGRNGPVHDSLRRPALYNMTLQLQADSLCVVKHLRELYVFRKGKLLKIYRIALGDEPVGHKHVQGDEKTPEGLYFIDGKNPFSSCHKNLGISYPNAADRAYAKQLGQSPGGDIIKYMACLMARAISAPVI